MLRHLRRAPLAPKLALIYTLWVSMLPTFAADPGWWNTAGTKIWETTPSSADHHAPVNLGQLKHVASMARAHLDATVTAAAIPGFTGTGSSTTVGALVDGFTQVDNHAPANVGQLKAVAAAFYDRLHQIGYDTRSFLVTNGVSDTSLGVWNPDPPYYPWDPSAPAAENHAPANVGQLKLAFSFDLSTWSANADTDGDGLTNGQEMVAGSHAGIADENGDGAPDGAYTLDADGDGLYDWWEIARFGSVLVTTGSADPDGDGLSNADEFANHTDPNLADTDGDGTDDSAEITASTNPSAILAGHWPLDETWGTAAPDSDPSRQAGIVSGATWSPGTSPFSGALLFDAAAEHLSLPSRALGGATDITLSVWFKTSSAETGASDRRTLFSTAASGTPDLLLQVDGDGEVNFKPGGGVSTTVTAGAAVAVNDSRWHHLAAVKDSAAPAAVRLYLDGVEVTSDTTAGLVAATAVDRGKLIVGQEVTPAGGWVAGRGFLGQLDEVEVYRRALSASEVAAIWNRDGDGDTLPDRWEFRYFADRDEVAGGDPDADGLSNAEEHSLGFDPSQADLPGLVVRYDFDGPAGTNIVDGVGTSDDGTFSNSGATNPIRASDPIFGGYVIMEGEQEKISIPPTVLHGQGDFTFSLRLKPTSVSAAPKELPLLEGTDSASGVEFAFGLAELGKTFFDFPGTGRLEWTHPSLNDSKWHELAVVRNVDEAGTAHTVTLYIDGVPIGTQATTGFGGTLNLSGGALLFGRTLAGNGEASAAIDHFEIYTRALSPLELGALPAKADANGNSITDAWEDALRDHDGTFPTLPSGGGIDPTATIAAYGLTAAEAYAQGLAPDGSDALSLAKLKDAFAERYQVARGSAITWVDGGTTTLSSTLATLNQISYELDTLKRWYLNADFAVNEGGARISRPWNLIYQGSSMLGTGTKDYATFDDNSLPPVGRVTRENYVVKIRQLAIAIGKLKYLLLSPTSIASTTDTDSTVFNQYWNEDPMNPGQYNYFRSLSGSPDYEADPGGVKTKLPDAFASGIAAGGGANTRFGPWPDFPGVLSSSRSPTTVQFSTAIGGTAHVIESLPWQPEAATLSSGASFSIIDQGVATRVTSSHVLSGSGTHDLTPSNNTISAAAHGAQFDVTLNTSSAKRFYQYVEPAGTDLKVPATAVSHLRNENWTGAPYLTSVDHDASVEVELHAIFEPNFVHKLPDLRSAVLPSYGSDILLGDFAMDTGRAKLVVPLGVGVRGRNAEASLTLILDAPWEGRNASAIEGVAHPYERYPLGVGHITSLSFSGVKADFDIVYENDFTNLETLSLPSYLTTVFDTTAVDEPGLSIPAANKLNAAEAEVRHRIDIWTRPRLRQVKGAQIFADIIDNDDSDPRKWHIDLYWSADIGAKSGGLFPVDTNKRIRRVTVEDITDYDTNGAGTSGTVKLKASGDGGRTYTLDGSGGLFSQTWELDHTYAGGSDDITATYTYSIQIDPQTQTALPGGGTATHKVEGTRDGVNLVEYNAEFAYVPNGGFIPQPDPNRYWYDPSPFDPHGVMTLSKQGGGAASGNADLRTLTYEYHGTPDPSEPTSTNPPGTGFPRLKKITYGGTDTTWTQNGRVDTFDGDSGGWGGLATSTHTLDGKALVTTVTGDGSTSTTLDGTEVRTSAVTLGGSLSAVTVSHGGDPAKTTSSVEYLTAGPYAWSPRKTTAPNGDVTTTLYGLDSAGKTTVTQTAVDGPSTITTETVLDPNGTVLSSQTDVGSVVTSRYEVAPSDLHPSGAPLKSKDLHGLETVATYYDDGRIHTSLAPESSLQTYTYDALGRVATLARSVSGNAYTTTYTYSDGAGGPGYKETTPNATKYEEAYNFHGELTSGTYGRDARATTVSYSTDRLTRTTTTGLVTDTATYHADGFLKEWTSNAAPSASGKTYTYALGVTAGQLTRSSTFEPLGLAETTHFDKVGRTAKIVRPRADTPATTADWTYSYPDAETVRVTDPDNVVTETAYDGSRLKSLGVVGLDALNFTHSAAGSALGTEVKLGAQTLASTSLNPSERRLRHLPHGLPDRATTLEAGLPSGNASEVALSGRGGLRGTFRYTDGVYQEADGSGIHGPFEDTLERHPDLSAKKNHGTAAGAGYSDQFRLSDGAPTQIDRGERKTAIVPTETAGGGYDLTVTETGHAARSYSLSGDGLSASASGEDIVDLDLTITPDAAGKEIDAALQMAGTGGPTTNFTATPYGGGKTKQLAEDAAPTTTVAYTPAGRVASVTDGKGQTHTLNRPGGNPLVSSITSADPSTDVTLGRDSAGRVNSVTDAAGTRAPTRDARGQHTGTNYTSGEFSGAAVTHAPDDAGNVPALAVSGGGVSYAVNYGYRTLVAADDAGDQPAPTGSLATVSVPALNYTATYGYTPPADGDPARTGVASLRHSFGGRAAVEESYAYFADNEIASGQYPRALERRTATVFAGTGNPGGQVGFTYVYEGHGKRNRVGLTDTGGLLSLYPDGQQWIFSYMGAGPQPGYTGQLASATYGIGGTHYLYRYNNFGVRTQSGNVIYTANTQGSRVATVGGATVNYDLNGSRTGTGATGDLDFLWSDTNRLAEVKRPDGTTLAKYTYDSQGRRHSKTLYAADGTTVTAQHFFLYRGWDLLVERVKDGAGAVVRERQYVWGLDLDGTPDGAGGVGGLLLVVDTDIAADPDTLEYSIPLYDGGGNVVALADAGSGAIVAEYAYGPFGEPRGQSGPRAASNPFRYSTHYTDDETGLVYYGYRYYDPNTGTWLSRDPMGEAGGLNLYAFLNNDPLNAVDYLGMVDVPLSDIPTLLADPSNPWEVRNEKIFVQHLLRQFGAASGSVLGGSREAVGSSIDFFHRTAEPATLSKNPEFFAALGEVYGTALVGIHDARTAHFRATPGASTNPFSGDYFRGKMGEFGRAGAGIAEGGIDFGLELLTWKSAISTIADGQTTRFTFSGFEYENASEFDETISYAGFLLALTPLGLADDAGRALGGMRSGAGSIAGSGSRGLFSEISGEAMDPALFRRIQTAFERRQGRIMGSNPMTEKHLGPNRLIEGETLSENVIALRMNPSTSSVYEELIHTAQLRRGMNPQTQLLEMEIEAARKLIRFADRYKIPASETARTQARLLKLLEAQANR